MVGDMTCKMREILFRGKRKDNGKWTYGFYALFASNKGLKHGIYTGAENGCVIPYEVISETVGQYTGLTDKNGNKIFEGDIVKSCFRGEADKEPMTVEFRIERRGWFPFACGDGCGCCEVDTYPPEYTEVIGNIYDNPGLLGE